MIQRALGRAILLTVMVCLLGAAGCSGSSPLECPDDYPATCPDGGATFAMDVAPMIHSRCSTCHGSGQQPPLLQSYANVRSAASVIHLQLTHCPPLMPKAPIAPLTANERRQIFSWLACGAMDN